ncbi:MAG: PKD domain-containing protein [Cyclobacteriaceae bacterium]
MRLFSLVILLAAATYVHAQCPAADFTIPSAACINSSLDIDNNSTAGTYYSWDFCSGDLDLTPEVTPVVSNSLLFRTRALRVVNHNNTWYAFTIDQSTNKLIRLNFGTNLSNTPVIIDLGNPGNALNGVFDLCMVNESGYWYALVVNTGSNSLVRLAFGTDIESMPTVQNLGSLGVLNTPNSIFVVNDNNFLRAFISNGGVAEIVRLDFGTSVLNNPVATVLNVPGASGLRGIAITRECDRWFGLVTSYNNNKVFWIDFINGLSQPPQIGEITFFTSYNFPASIAIASDGGNYYAFIQSAIGFQYRLSFGSSITDKLGTGQNFGNFGISNENFAIELVKTNSDWIGFTIDLTNRRLIRQNFPLPCDASPATAIGEEPPFVSFSSSGIKKIALSANDALGAMSYVSKTLTVTGDLAPDIQFISQNQCANNDVLFTPFNSSGNITSYHWNFGDGNTSSIADPVHIYTTAGAYTPQLTVTASNGCQNVARNEIIVFNPPVVDFQLPAVIPICTNQAYLFQNISTFDAGSTISWNWQVNSVDVSADEDLQFTFTNSIPHEIKLVASIPGCSNEVVKNISSLVPGPAAGFNSSGHCQLQFINFVNTTSGSVLSYFWDFGDSNTSTEENPVHPFVTPGTYYVQLMALNAAGCVNTITQPITIYSKPETDFTVALPPFSCSGSATQFNDATPNPPDSNIASWFWDFDDGGSTATLKNPQHVYANAGTYQVSLTTTTNFGCSASVTKPANILPSPVVDFNHTPPCRNIPVTFTDATPGTNQSWFWQIESSFYTVQNPVHTFTTSGNKNVMLAVTGTNGCVGLVSRQVVVPLQLVPDFTVEKNCINQQTQFSDNTNDFADPIASWQWTFGTLGTATGNPSEFTFSSTGNVNVNLLVTTQTGCSYSRLKSVSISAAPVASFTASPAVGEAPLPVTFTNTSTGATSYLWQFGDSGNSTSTVISPQFTFTELGEYPVRLTAYNALNCIHQVMHTIYVVVPVINVEVSMLELLTSQNSVVPAVTLINRSNVPVQNPLLRFDLSGSASINEVVPVIIPSNSSYRHVAGFFIPIQGGLDYVCTELLVEDITPDNNRLCSTIESSFQVLEPYPNPVYNKHPVTLGWISATEGSTAIRLLNSAGQEVFSTVEFTDQGYNLLKLSTRNLHAGLYILQISSGNASRNFRLVVGE